jgi:broad specificity phosphatase PhoE
MSKTKHITFIRHGESVSSSLGIRQRDDEGLHPDGIMQAEKLRDRLRSYGVPCERLFSSPLARAVLTAQYIHEATGAPIEILPEARERKTPTRLDGTPMRSPETLKVIEHIFELWVTDPTARYEDGESYAELMARVQKVMETCEQAPEHHIVVVSHATFTKAVLNRVLHADQHSANVMLAIYHSHEIANTSLTHFTFSPEKGWRLVTWNDHAHLMYR